MVATLEKEQNKYEEMKQKLCEPHFQKLKEAEETWNQVKDEISKIIENNLNEGNVHFIIIHDEAVKCIQ